MVCFLIDAGAVAKRYVTELGSPNVIALVNQVGADRLLVLELGIVEVVSIFVRKRNQGILSPALYEEALAQFELEIAHHLEVEKLSADSQVIVAAIELVQKHSLNATDAVLLRLALDLSATLRSEDNDLVVVSSDKRLLRSCVAENLQVFNPEVDDSAVLGEFISQS